MDPLFRLETILSDWTSLFKHNNFNHFHTFVTGLIRTPHRGTMTTEWLCLPTSHKLKHGVLAEDR